MSKSAKLIAYFSRAGENYSSGGIVDLPVGNTEVAARIIQKLTGGDIFRIDPVTSYPQGYQEATEVAREELHRDARPALSVHVDNMGDYGEIYLGYPNWWGTMPMAVFTFLEAHDFSGKTIVPFCTHEGSGMGRSERDIGRVCTGATVSKGLAIRGSLVSRAEKDIADWLGKTK